MMTTSELMRAMSEAGAPFEAILIAVQALEAKEAEIAARDQERSARRAKDAERKRRARASADGPATVHGRGADSPARPSLSLLPNEKISNPSTHTHPDKTPVRGKGPVRPDGVSAQIWADFVTLRKAKRAPVSATVIAGIAREAGKAGWSLEAALAECTARGWQGFRAEWVAPAVGAAGKGTPPDEFLAHLTARKQREQHAGPAAYPAENGGLRVSSDRPLDLRANGAKHWAHEQQLEM